MRRSVTRNSRNLSAREFTRQLGDDAYVPPCDYKALRAENAKRHAKTFPVEQSPSTGEHSPEPLGPVRL